MIARLLLGALAVDPGGHALEPGLAVGIGQRNAGMHLGDIGLRMQRNRPPRTASRGAPRVLRDGRLARARDAHDHQDRRAAAMGARAVEAMDAGCIGDEDRIGAADEQAAFDHPDDAPDALLQPRRIGDGAEIAVENAVAAVGDKRLARPPTGAAERWRRAPRALAWVASRPKATTSTGTGVVRPQPIDQLGAVDDDGEAAARGRDDLLAQQGAAQPLDQIERAALDLVGAVDREIDLPMLGEGGERNARGLRLRRRSLRGGNADEAQALPMTPRQRLDRESRRRAGAEPDDHAILDQLAPRPRRPRA